MKKRIFCLLLAVAIMASLGVSAFAEADVVDPATPDPASTEVNTPPAEDNSAESAPAPDTAPASEPAQDQVTEPSVQDQEPAADVQPAEGGALGGEPATIEGDPTPIEVPAPAELELTLAADKLSISVQDAYDAWKTMQSNRDTWRDLCPDGFITLTLTGAPEGADVQWSVKPNEGGAGAGYDGSTGTTCVGIANGSTLYLTGGSDISGCPNGHVYNIAVSATVNGTTSNVVTVTFVCQREEEQTTPPEKPEDTADNYAYGVWLHVINGGFTGTYGAEGKDVSDAASVWVEFMPESADESGAVTAYSRKLPTELPTASAANGTFDGWYTQSPTEAMVNSTDGSYCYRSTTAKNGQKIVPGETEVPEGVQVLYAVFDYHEPLESEDHLIQYYFDYNGMNGMYGHCITSTGVLGKSQFTPATAAVYNFNFSDNPDVPGHYVGEPTWEGLAAYWAKTSFSGYTFKGWSLQEKGGDIIGADTPITNGMTFYAVWEKADDGTNSESFEKPTVGSLDFIKINSGFNVNTHAAKGSTLTVSIDCHPIGAVAENVTYNLVFSPNSDGDIRNIFKKPETRTVTAGAPFNADDAEGFGFKAEVVGTSLVVTDLDGQAHGIRVSVTAESIEGTPVAAIEPATLSFEHQTDGKWERTLEPTCTAYGQEEATCTVCHEKVIRKIYPLSHVFDFRVITDPTCTDTGLYGKACMREGCDATYADYMKELGMKGGSYEDTVIPANGHEYELVSASEPVDGIPVYIERCIHGDAEGKSVKVGDTNDDGYISASDINQLYKYFSSNDKPFIDEVGDTNGDHYVSASDINQLYKYFAGSGTLG